MEPPSPSESSQRGASDQGYLLLGEDAIYSVINKGITRAEKFYSHPRPADPEDWSDSDDITDAPTQRVGQMLQFYTGQHAYLLVELAKADQHLTAADTTHGTVKKQKSILLDSGQTKYRLDAELAQDKELQKLYMRVMEAQAFRDMLQALVRGVELKRDLCSREITRRQTERA